MTAALRLGTLDARRRWFGLDAAVTGVNALGYVFLATWLSEQLGAAASTYRIVGAGLLAFAIGVGAYAASRDAARPAGWAIVAVNAAWVVSSLVVALAGIGDFDGLGRAWIAAQAVVVGALTVLQVSTIHDVTRHRNGPSIGSR